MTPLRATYIAFLCLTFVGTASARTPTPTTTATPAPVATATPTPPRPASFGGTVWADARVVGDRDITAMIGHTVCATEHPPFVTPPGSGGPAFGIVVPSNEALLGCGYEGAVVTFLIGDQRAPQTAVWHAGMFQALSLTVGYPFANFFTTISTEVEHILRAGGRIVPYVGDKVCGYGGVVYSYEQDPGCGVEGSQITFKLLDAQGNVIAVANQTATWYAWDGTSAHLQRLNLTFGSAGGITMPGTGAGAGPRGHATAFAVLAIALSGIGLATVATAAALRKKTTTR